MPYIPESWDHLDVPEAVAESGSTIGYKLDPTDHPGAIVFGLNAPAVVAGLQHLDHVPSLTKVQAYHLLLATEKARAAAADLADTLLIQLRATGASWAEIGAALDVHRSTAKHRYLAAAERYGRASTVGEFEPEVRVLEFTPERKLYQPEPPKQRITVKMHRSTADELTEAMRERPTDVVRLTGQLDDGQQGTWIFRVGRLQWVD